VNEPLLGQRELEYVTECLRTGWISSAGRFIEEFEAQWAAYCVMKYGIAVSNGTTALQVAVRCLDLKPGDEVILPTLTIISCALAIVECGAVPVLIDSDPRTWCLDVSQVGAKITEHTRAIMPVHIYGHSVDMDPLLDLAEKHGLVIIEDAAEVHGAEYLSGRDGANPAWTRCGGLGHISTFSFYANKPITTGEGGMVLTNDIGYAARARSLRNLCFRPERRFYHTELGYNCRLTNLQAALGLAQLERFDEILAKKRWVGQAYTGRLKGIPLYNCRLRSPGRSMCTGCMAWSWMKRRTWTRPSLLAGCGRGAWRHDHFSSACTSSRFFCNGVCSRASATRWPSASPARDSICPPGWR
jgi:perosamine synthetase